MQEKLMESLKEALKAGDKLKVSTLRLIQAAIKNKEIEARAQGKTLSSDDILELLPRLIKTRQESAHLYKAGGRPELAEKEHHEIAIIRSFLPPLMEEQELKAAIQETLEVLGAAGVKDMNKIIIALRSKYPGQIDFSEAHVHIKEALDSPP